MGTSAVCTMNGNLLENTVHFKYLGSWISHGQMSIGSKEIQFRINSAQGAFFDNRALFTNFKIPLNTRVMFANSLIRSRLCYGSHAWALKQGDIDKLEASYRSHLRSLVHNGHKRRQAPKCPACKRLNVGKKKGQARRVCSTHESTPEEIDWRPVITNDRLMKITNTQNLSDYVKNMQRNWIMHVIRRDNTTFIKALTFNSNKNRKRGRLFKTVYDRVTANEDGMESFFRECMRKVTDDG